MTSFYPYNVVTATATFRNSAGSVVDPSGVVFVVKPPNGAALQTYTYLTDAQVTRTSTGIYVLTLEPDTAGRWYVEAKGSASNKGALGGAFDVLTSLTA